MRDFIKNYNNTVDNSEIFCVKERISKLIQKESTTKVARNASLFSLASVLGACNFGGGSDSIAPLNISAIKGPLSGALAFVDRDGDGVYDEGEEYAVTNATGGAQITPTSAVSATDKLVITSISAGQTIGGTTYATATVDTNTGGTVADLVLKAPSNSTVVTPVTTMVAETGLSEAAIKDVLGLPADMDVLNFNPFKADLTEAEKTVALAAEKVALKVYTTISTIQASAKSSGLDAAKAFETAIEAVSDVVKEQSAAGAKADLSDSSIIDKVVTKTETVLTTKLQESGFDAAAVTAAVSANKAVLATAKAQIKTVNDAADAITSFDATELGAIAKLAVKSGEEAAAAVTAEKATPGSGAAAFTMKTADAVATAKAKAKTEVAEAKGEETTTTTTTTTAAVTKPFVLTDGTTVDWTITKSNGNMHASIDSNTSPNATYTVSGNTMTINMGQGFSLGTVQDLLTEKADLTFALSLASLPSVDDKTSNTTTVTITEDADLSSHATLDGTRDSGEGQIVASAKSTYTATSSTQTDFNFAGGDPISITYSPRSGNSDVAVSITNPSDNMYSVGNDGNFNNNGGQAVMELMATKFFDKLDDNTSNWAKSSIMTNFVNANSKGVHISINTSDLGLYNGSTKINTVETSLFIGNNPMTGGVVTGTAREGSVLTATAIGDLDGTGTVTQAWKSASTADGTYSAIAGATGLTYTIQNADVNKFIKFTATYTDGQGNAVNYASDATAQVATNASPTGSVTVSYDYSPNTEGSTLTATNDLADADTLGTITYTWQKATGTIDASTNWTDLGTGSTYKLTSSEVGAKVRALAKYTDGNGTAEQVGSTVSSAVIDSPIYYKVDTSGYLSAPTGGQKKIGIYLDTTDLTGTQLSEVRAVVGKFALKDIDANSNGSYADAGDQSPKWGDNFTKVGSKYMLVEADSGKNADLVGWTLSSTGITSATATTAFNHSFASASGTFDLTGKGQFKIGEITIDPTSASEKTYVFTFDPSDVIGVSLAHTASSTALDFLTHEFALTF